MEQQHHEKLADIAKKYSPIHLQCRTMGHSWAPLAASWRQDGNIDQALKCSRCETQRLQILDKNGYVVKGNYAYARDYTFTGVGRLDVDGRALLRKTHVLRMLGN